jgi:hypothetical protein
MWVAAGMVAATVVGGVITKSGSKGSSSSMASSDPQIGEAALKQADTGQQELEFYKQVYAESKPRLERAENLANQLTEQQLEISDFNQDIASQEWQRFQKTYVPVEDKMVSDAMTIDSEGEQARAAGEAAAGVQSQYDNGMAQGRRSMAAMGINPNSGRASALEQEGALGLAASKAGAATGARLAVRDRGVALRAGAANLGRGLGNTVSNAYGTAITAGNSSLNNQATVNNMANANANMVSQGYSGALSGYSGQANTLLNLKNSNLTALNMEQQADAASSAGYGQLAGQLGSAAIMAYSSKKVKTDKRKIDPNTVIKGLRRTPVEKWRYKDGVADGGEHIGPYAEDMQREFGDAAAPGGKMIDIVSMIGINMAATKALDSKIEQMDKRVAVVAKGLNRGKKKKEDRR